ncbi:hypothetical protein D3C76_1075310 [compost metagenome]
MILGGPAVLAQSLEACGQFLIVGHNCTTITQGAEVFGGVETETSHITKASGLTTIALCAVRLCAILNQFHAGRMGQSQQFFDICQLTVKVSDNHALGLVFECL